MGYKNEEYEPILANIENSIDNNMNAMEESRSSYFSRSQYNGKGEKARSNLDSNTMTVLNILSHMFGFTFLLAPFAFKTIGMLYFGIGLLLSLLINYYSVWLMNKTERRFSSDYVQINSLFELTWNCYGNSVIAFQEFVKFASLIIWLVSFNIYLGTESEEILCKTMGGTACGKYDHLIRIAYNIMTVPIIFQSELKGKKIIRFMGFVSFVFAFGILSFLQAQTLKN